MDVVETLSCIYYDEQTKESVLMVENKEVKRVKGMPKKVFEAFCLEHGSTLKGRLTNFCHVLHVKQKPCILVNELGCILFIPTLSMSSTKCQYFQYNKIKEVKRCASSRCQLITKAGTIYALDVDIRVIRKQMKRSQQFIQKLRERNQKYILMEIKACYNIHGD